MLRILTIFVALVQVLVLADVEVPPAHNWALARCNGCAALTTEVCRQVIDHMEVMTLAAYADQYDANDQLRAKKGANSRDDIQKTAEPYVGDIVTYNGVVDAALETMCEPHVVRQYRFAPNVEGLSGHCSEFYVGHKEIIDEFWYTFHRKSISCATAVDLLCAYITDVCKWFDTEDVILNNVATKVYQAPHIPDEGPGRDLDEVDDEEDEEETLH
jgi:hypothetical protein